MQHVTLTCTNHQTLRWSCKSIAYTPGYGYNGARNIFFLGDTKHDGPQAECSCRPQALILAPEDP
jgi:hypothetical protein